MTWQETQNADRERFWAAFERGLAELPPNLFGQVKLTEFDLALRWSTSGQFRDVLGGVGQFPLLSIGGWLIRDLGGPGHHDPAVEQRLYRSAAQLAMRDHVAERGLDDAWSNAAGTLALVQLLTHRSALDLAGVGGAARSEADRETILNAGLEAIVSRDAWSRAPDPPADPDLYLLPRWSASARTGGRVALGYLDRDDVVADVDALIDRLAGAFEILADLSTIHADLLAGRITYPIASAIATAGLALTPRPEPTAVLGSLIVSSSLGTIRAAAADRLADARRIAEEVPLPTFAAFVADVEAGLPGSAKAAGIVGGPITIVEPTVGRAIAMAIGYLRADPLLTESWETHREGMFGAPLVAARFPAGLVLEILARHGEDVTDAADVLIDHGVANRFRYFDHPWSGIDTDTIGGVLRLLAGRDPRPEWASALNSVLACLDRDVAASGHVPVWIADCEGAPVDRPPLPDLGEHCGTVAAHLLLGLAAYAPEDHAATIERGATSLVSRIGEVGLAANVNYPRPYALATWVRLIRDVEGFVPSAASDAARTVLLGELDRQLAWRAATPQQAALVTTACIELAAADRIDPRWRSVILAGQRADGGWPGEPFAVVPTRDRTVTWYRSSQLTTALCYDALVRLEGSPSR